MLNPTGPLDIGIANIHLVPNSHKSPRLKIQRRNFRQVPIDGLVASPAASFTKRTELRPHFA